MPHYFFIWTPEIVEHLAEHEVSPEEFEEVVSDPDYGDVSRSTGNPSRLVRQVRDDNCAACTVGWTMIRLSRSLHTMSENDHAFDS